MMDSGGKTDHGSVNASLLNMIGQIFNERRDDPDSMAIMLVEAPVRICQDNCQELSGSIIQAVPSAEPIVERLTNERAACVPVEICCIWIPLYQGPGLSRRVWNIFRHGVFIRYSRIDPRRVLVGDNKEFL
eukprot:COSAG01_NODE_2661_length_7295_cov_10.017371_5_plen_131_part_00